MIWNRVFILGREYFDFEDPLRMAFTYSEGIFVLGVSLRTGLSIHTPAGLGRGPVSTAIPYAGNALLNLKIDCSLQLQS